MEHWAGSFAAALVFAAIYAMGGWLSSSEAVEKFWARRIWISAAACVSVAYIFVDVLPELEFQRQALVEASDIELFAEQRVYVLALLSFVVFYGLEHIVLVRKARRRQVVDEGAADPVYLLQLAGYAAYSALIGYLLIERAERGVFSLLVYSFAMAVHFLIVDHSLDEEHGPAYGSRGRWCLAASVMLGWLVGLLLPLSESMVARLFAILAGGVVITSLQAELPNEREGRFWPFSIGAVLFAALLLLA